MLDHVRCSSLPSQMESLHDVSLGRTIYAMMTCCALACSKYHVMVIDHMHIIGNVSSPNLLQNEDLAWIVSSCHH